MKTPKEIYAEVRRQHPDRPFGDHWESIGVHLGDTWADPEYLDIPGEYEFEYKALRRLRRA